MSEKPTYSSVPRDSVWQCIWRATLAGEMVCEWNGPLPEIIKHELSKGGYKVISNGNKHKILLQSSDDEYNDKGLKRFTQIT